MRVSGLLFFSIVWAASLAPALAGEALPDKGATKFAAYEICRPLAVVDMGAAGSEASTECNGIVKSLDGQKPLDNLSIHCLEATSARPEAYKYAGSCAQTDADGDKLFMTYEGSKTGQVKWIGGTGKYKDVGGSGSLGVVVAPSGGANLFGITLNYDVAWTNAPK